MLSVEVAHIFAIGLSILLPRLLIAGFTPRRPRFAPVSVRMGFVVDIVAARLIFLRVFRLFPVSIIILWFHIYTSSGGGGE
jgi:hypothetical protein